MSTEYPMSLSHLEMTDQKQVTTRLETLRIALLQYSISDLLHVAFNRLRAIECDNQTIAEICKYHIDECRVSEMLTTSKEDK